jgi:uncharacterized protein
MRLPASLAVTAAFAWLALGLACTPREEPEARVTAAQDEAEAPPGRPEGDAAPKDAAPVPQTDARLRARCETGSDEGALQACLDLALRLREGHGSEITAPQPTASIELLHRACDRKHAAACAELGLSYQDGLGLSKDLSRAADLYRSACEAGAGRGCSRLGALYLTATFVSRDTALAHGYSETGCEHNDGLGCVNLGLMYQRGDGVKRDPERAVQLHYKACMLEEGRGCTLLGELYAAGSGVARNPKLAELFNGRGCVLGDGRGCGNVGVSFQVGFGAQQSPRRAAHYFKRACAAGEQRFCDLLERFRQQAIEQAGAPAGVVSGAPR